MSVQQGPDLLATIVAATRRAVAVRQEQRPLSVLERDVRTVPNGGSFTHALGLSPAPRIIAECKRRSPSRGILREQYDAPSHARAYEAAGAAAISVLTEPTFFDGCLEHLRAVRAAVAIPILRKDFIVSDYQVHESASMGADALLLIAGALDDATLRRLLALATDRGLAALVEAHDSEELTRAVDAGAAIIGVNSRNLRTLEVDPSVHEALAVRVDGRSHILVAESGIRTPDDIARLSAAGYSAFLVGERLIAKPDPGAALAELRGER